MRFAAALGVIALVPAALNASPPAARTITVPLCTGDGSGKTIDLPAGRPELPGQDVPGCCAKACHTGSRKKIVRGQIDAGQ